MSASDCVKFTKKLCAIDELMLRMFGDTLRDQDRGVILAETGKDRLAIGGAMQGEALSDGGERDEALLTWNLVDEHGRAA